MTIITNWTNNMKGSRQKTIAYCPKCGNPIAIVGHEILSDGTLSPTSLACPHEGCDFNDIVKLENHPSNEPQ